MVGGDCDIAGEGRWFDLPRFLTVVECWISVVVVVGIIFGGICC